MYDLERIVSNTPVGAVIQLRAAALGVSAEAFQEFALHLQGGDDERLHVLDVHRESHSGKRLIDWMRVLRLA